MRRFNWLMTMLVAGAMTFAACGDDPTKPDTPNTPDNPTVDELTFTVELGDVSRTTMTYNVTPSNLDANYFAVAFEAKAVEQCESDEAIVAMIYEDIEAYVTSINKTFDEYMAENIAKGKRENVKIEDLVSNTNYYLLLFGVDAAADYKATSDVSLTRFKTDSSEMSACTFEIKAEPYLNSAAIDVTPSIASEQWALVNVDVDTLTLYTSTDGEYAWTKEQFFAYHLQTQISNLQAEGESDDAIRTKLFHTGAKTLNAAGLKPKTKYACFVAGVQMDSEGLWLTTLPKELRYNAGEAAVSDVTFDIQVSNVGHYSADIRIVPSDVTANYYYVVLPYDGKTKDAKAIDLVDKYIREKLYYWEGRELMHLDPVQGVQDFTGDNSFKVNVAEMEYYILAFSYELNPTYGTLIDEENGIYDENPGTLTSAPALVTFTTAEQGDPMTAEFTFSASDVGPYGFTMELNTNDPTVYYMPGVAVAGTFDAQALIANYSGFLKTQMELYQVAEPGISNHRALEEWGSSYFRNGDGKYAIKNLLPNTEYVGYVLVIDASKGIFVRGVASETIATTTSVGEVSPSIELLGIYNGNDENGSIFGDANATVGAPIVAVKHTNFDGASALYTAISEGDDIGENGQPVSDQYIIAQFYSYWNEVNLTVPYFFFVAQWDVDHLVVSYAKDANGREGGVARLVINDWSNIGDIEELRGYVEELNAVQQPAASAKSLVISEEDAAPQLDCIWSQNVGAPREAKVVKHDVELPRVESDLVEVKVIKTFRL